MKFLIDIDVDISSGPVPATVASLLRRLAADIERTRGAVSPLITFSDRDYAVIVRADRPKTAQEYLESPEGRLAAMPGAAPTAMEHAP